jgi:hypothetical protein
MIYTGIQKRKREEWIRIDKGYPERLQEREPLIRDKPDFTVGTGPLVDPAIEELYQEVMADYLPQRYPTIFKLKSGDVYNTITGDSYPLSTDDLSPAQMLERMGRNVEGMYSICFPGA